MDALLSKFGAQVLNYAIRSGIAITSTYAVGQCSRLLQTVDDDDAREELMRLQKLLSSKTKIISSAISLIELKSGRGNPLLQGAIPLAKSLHQDIISLGRRLERAASETESLRRSSTSSSPADLRGVIADIKALLARFDSDIPSLQLAISVSGESLATTLPPGISPSRLLQASMLLTVGDTQYAMDPGRPVHVGPVFTLSLYMLFLGHAAGPPQRKRYEEGQVPVAGRADQQRGQQQPRPHTPPEYRGGGDGGAKRRQQTRRPRNSSSTAEERDVYGLGEGDRKPLWQEVMHKARVRLCRTPPDFVFDPIEGYRPARTVRELQRYGGGGGGTGMGGTGTGMGDYAYHLEIIEDLDDGRVHDDDNKPSKGPQHEGYDNVPRAGMRESIPIFQLSKIFYTDTGSILNIGNAIEGDNNPVLLLKRDVQARRPAAASGVGAPSDGTGHSAATGGDAWSRDIDRNDDDDDDDDDEDNDNGGGDNGGTTDDDESAASSHDTQAEIDRQLFEEFEQHPPAAPASATAHAKSDGEAATDEDDGSHPPELRFPVHLDPEWIALEAFVDEEDDDSSGNGGSDSDIGQGSECGGDGSRPETPTKPPPGLPARERSSLDSGLIAQIKNLSLAGTGRGGVSPRGQYHSRSQSRPQSPAPPSYADAAAMSPPPGNAVARSSLPTSIDWIGRQRHPSDGQSQSEKPQQQLKRGWRERREQKRQKEQDLELERQQQQQEASFVARSPFGAITTSLSLMEMLVRLASLQEFQQAAHLSIPDYVLTFFLQETSSTGLSGEEGWRARNAARRRVGFDPYTDTPTK